MFLIYRKESRSNHDITPVFHTTGFKTDSYGCHRRRNNMRACIQYYTSDMRRVARLISSVHGHFPVHDFPHVVVPKGAGK